MDSLYQLPGEVFLEVASMLNLDDLSATMRVCKEWNELLNDNHLWATLCEIRWPYATQTLRASLPLRQGDHDWKTEFKERYLVALAHHKRLKDADQSGKFSEKPVLRKGNKGTAIDKILSERMGGDSWGDARFESERSSSSSSDPALDGARDAYSLRANALAEVARAEGVRNYNANRLIETDLHSHLVNTSDARPATAADFGITFDTTADWSGFAIPSAETNEDGTPLAENNFSFTQFGVSAAPAQPIVNEGVWEKKDLYLAGHMLPLAELQAQPEPEPKWDSNSRQWMDQALKSQQNRAIFKFNESTSDAPATPAGASTTTTTPPPTTHTDDTSTTTTPPTTSEGGVGGSESGWDVIQPGSTEFFRNAFASGGVKLNTDVSVPAVPFSLVSDNVAFDSESESGSESGSGDYSD